MPSFLRTPGEECPHQWERQESYCENPSDPNKGFQRFECRKCGIWGYSNPPYKLEVKAYAGPITQPPAGWKSGEHSALSMQNIAVRGDHSPLPSYDGVPIGWNPPTRWRNHL